MDQTVFEGKIFLSFKIQEQKRVPIYKSKVDLQMTSNDLQGQIQGHQVVTPEVISYKKVLI